MQGHTRQPLGGSPPPGDNNNIFYPREYFPKSQFHDEIFCKVMRCHPPLNLDLLRYLLSDCEDNNATSK